MSRCKVLGLLACFALAAAAAVTVASCSSSSGAAGLAAVCSINSDCNSPLICAFGRCHYACAESRDCSSGERCVSSGTAGVCQLAQESTCSATSSCGSSTLVCVSEQCRTACQPATSQATTCLKNQTCKADPSVSTASGACFDNVELDGGVLDGATSGMDASGAGDTGGGTPHDASGGDASDAGPAGNACPSAETQFGNVAQGDSNPAFFSGVGARTASQLLIFDTYDGPDPSGDGGGNNVGIVYAQAFDPQSGASKGPAQPLFTAPNLVTPAHTVINGGNGQFYLYSAAVAPTGQIVVTYSTRFYLGGSYDDGYALYAAFLDSSGDAGPAGLTLQKVVLLETATLGGQPHAIWSSSSQAFVLSWQYATSAWFVKVQKYLPDGRPAGGSTQVVPTIDPTGAIYGAGAYESGGVGESGNLFGVAYKTSGSLGYYDPGLTVLDALGNPVGPSVDVQLPGSSQNAVWQTVGGTAQGFVYFFDQQSPSAVTEVFVPASPDAGVIGGDLDGGDAGGFQRFSFPGAVRANAARAVGDMGGAGGVGLALLYSNGVSFAYVNADGVGHQGPNSLLAHSYGADDEVSMTNLQGSFVVSLYDNANHSTQIAASGCAH